MSRKLFGALTAVVVLNCIAVAATLVWPDTARSRGTQAVTASADAATADLDHVPAVAAPPQRAYIPVFLTMIDFERIVGDDHAIQRREYVPVVLTAIDFDGAFGSVNDARRGNTPPNREKLRNAGWKRILGPS